MADTGCEWCRHYAALESPYRYEKAGYQDGVTVYGFCTKDIARLERFFPVYILNGCCKSFQKLPRARCQKATFDEQIEISGVNDRSGTQKEEVSE